MNSKSATQETTQPSLNQDKRSTAVPCELDSVVFLESKELKYTEELENNSLCTDQDLTCCSESRGLTSLENPTSVNTPIPEADLLVEKAVLRDFLDTVDIDSDDDDVCGISVCANYKRQPKKGEELKRCSRCQITHYCSVDCKKKDWDFHRFACLVVAKRSATKET